MRLRFMIVLIFVLVASSAYADKYFGIYPTATMSDIKSIYPNAHFTYVKPAWMQDDQKFVSINGSGIEGTISVLFYNGLSASENWLKSLDDKESSGIELRRGEIFLRQSFAKRIENYKNNPEEDHWVVYEIRWSPPTNVKLSKFIKRYGKPNAEELDENMNVYKVWKNDIHDIQALMDDSNMITLVIYRFTDFDYLCSSDWKDGKACNPKDMIIKDNLIPSKKKKSKK